MTDLDEPEHDGLLDPGTPFEVVAEEPLYSQVSVAGADERWELESRIRFGRASVLRADQAVLRDLRHLVDRDSWDYSFVVFPFDLEPQSQGFYRSIRVTAVFRDPDIIARHLSPSPGSAYIPFDGRATIWGEGMSEMSWLFEPNADQDRLRPQVHRVMCLLQRPKDMSDVEVVIKVEAGITRTFMVFQHRTAVTRNPAHFRLSFTQGTFVPLPE
ncbi:hypothetical protein [Amycolatopsis japonica]